MFRPMLGTFTLQPGVVCGSYFLAPNLYDPLSVKDPSNCTTVKFLHPSGAWGHPPERGVSEGRTVLIHLPFLSAVVCR